MLLAELILLAFRGNLNVHGSAWFCRPHINEPLSPVSDW